MAWRVARSLDVLLGQLNALAPNRSKVSDGSIGDAAHATRDSDHNPWCVLKGQPLVTARDFTHDPAGGLDCNRLATSLVRARDSRLKYLIWNRRIWQGSWQPYSGADDHTHHLHLSVVAGPAADTTTPWNLGTGGFLMALTDQEQRDLYNRVFGMLRQRWYVTDADGHAVEVPADHAGAVPAAVLDTLDGNYLAGLATKPASLDLTDAQLEVLADKVAARLTSLRFVANTGAA
jgi:hypothetical protein